MGENEGARKTLTAFQLAMMTFFLTTGGPFGSEPAIGAGGMMYTLIGFVLVPLLWSLPQALMAAELSLMFPSNGGPIFWVHRAFGGLVGWINAYNTVVYYFLCNCLIVSLFTSYFEGLTEFWEITAVRFGLMVLVGLLNLFSVTWISYVSMVLIFLVEIPFYILLGIVIYQGDIRVADLLDRPDLGDVDWPLFVSITTWCFGGYDSLGTLAGEVKKPSSFVLGMAMSLPLTMANYLVPLAVGYMADPHWENWEEGYYATVASNHAFWLGICMVVASALSNFGQVNAGTTSLVRLMWAMAGGDDATTESGEVYEKVAESPDEENSSAPTESPRAVGTAKKIPPAESSNSSNASSPSRNRPSSDEEEESLPIIESREAPSASLGDDPEEKKDGKHAQLSGEMAGLGETMLPGFFAFYVRFYPLDSPIISVVFSSFVTALVASLLDFSYLVELTVSMRVLQLLLEYGALTVLRWTMPNHPRPFRVPLGTVGTLVIAIPTLCICALLVSLQDWTVTVVGFGVNLLFVVMFVLHRLRLFTFRRALLWYKSRAIEK